MQEPEADRRFIERIFQKERGRKPLSLREDFCGTAWMCADWVRSDPRRRAYGIDLDGPTLEYGRARHLQPLGEAASRAQLIQADVRRARTPKVDVACAFNFSYWVFHERAEMLRYFRNVRRGLVPGGAFLLDFFGGPDVQVVTRDRRRLKGFTYLWDQQRIDAIQGTGRYAIHFEFPDGTRLRNAFRYHWRIWHLSELRDLLREAGFPRLEVYWEGATATGEGNGVFRKRRSADNEDAWIAYLVAWR